MFPPNHDQLINNFKILHYFPNKIDLQLAEAFEIKSKNPIMNVKYNELSSMLGFFFNIFLYLQYVCRCVRVCTRIGVYVIKIFSTNKTKENWRVIK